MALFTGCYAQGVVIYHFSFEHSKSDIFLTSLGYSKVWISSVLSISMKTSINGTENYFSRQSGGYRMISWFWLTHFTARGAHFLHHSVFCQVSRVTSHNNNLKCGLNVNLLTSITSIVMFSIARKICTGFTASLSFWVWKGLALEERLSQGLISNDLKISQHNCNYFFRKWYRFFRWHRSFDLNVILMVEESYIFLVEICRTLHYIFSFKQTMIRKIIATYFGKYILPVSNRIVLLQCNTIWR